MLTTWLVHLADFFYAFLKLDNFTKEAENNEHTHINDKFQDNPHATKD